MSKKIRRSWRLFKSVPILLIGSDAEGRPFSLESPNAAAIYVPACVVNISEFRSRKFRCVVAFCAWQGHGPTPGKNQPAAWAALLASAES